MWLFKKKNTIRSLTEEDEEDRDICEDELPTFEPEILSDVAARTKEAAKKESASEAVKDDIDTGELPYIPEKGDAPQFGPMHFNATDAEFDDDEPAEELPEEAPSPFADKPSNGAEDGAPQQEEDKKAPETPEKSDFWAFDALEGTEKASEKEPKQETVKIAPAEQIAFPDDFGSESTPGDIYAHLKGLPYTSRGYALSNDRLYLFHPDGKGKLYLFEQFGDFDIVDPEDCKAFIRITSFGGTFRGTKYTTTDLEYIIKQKNWPLTIRVNNRRSYDEAVTDGFVPVKKPGAGKGMLMTKTVSLYRLKDLHLTAEITVPGPAAASETYRVDLPRTLLEATDGEKPFKKLCKSVIDLVTEQAEDPFFTAQILKVCRNLVVCFPLEGAARTGDLFAGGVVTAVAPLDNGTTILQIGSDQKVRLPLSENAVERGQHRLTLIDETVQ